MGENWDGPAYHAHCHPHRFIVASNVLKDKYMIWGVQTQDNYTTIIHCHDSTYCNSLQNSLWEIDDLLCSV